MNTATLNITFGWFDSFADGSKCEGCGEPIFLKAWELRIVQRLPEGETVSTGAPLAKVCDSCHDIIRFK